MQHGICAEPCAILGSIWAPDARLAYARPLRCRTALLLLWALDVDHGGHSHAALPSAYQPARRPVDFALRPLGFRRLRLASEAVITELGNCEIYVTYLLPLPHHP